MLIEVKEGVFWDTENAAQSEEAITWLQEDVRPNLSQPQLDAFQRPHLRVYENETLTVTEEQLYINENYDWARKGVKYVVTLKDGSDDEAV